MFVHVAAIVYRTWPVPVHEDQYHVESDSMKGALIHTKSIILLL